MSLFRPEALKAREDHLHGAINIAVPMSWQAIGYLILIIVVCAAVFLSLATYSRTETVPGEVVTDKGVASITPTRSGVIAGITVAEGQSVNRGDALVAVRAEEDLSSGSTAPADVLNALRDEDRSLSAQSMATGSAAAAQLDQIKVQQRGLADEIGTLRHQISLQHSLIASAQSELERVRPIASRGFISGHDVRQREEAVMLRQQQLSQLQQTLSTKLSALSETSRQFQQVSAQATAQASSIASSRAAVAQQTATTGATRGYVLRSPIKGTVTSLTARIGQLATVQAPLLAIIPSDAKLRVDLYVPTSAIGFLTAGQDVRLAIDAFPYQRFGTVVGRVTSVARFTVNRPGPSGTVIPVYLVTAELAQDSVTAYGRQEMLRPGMTLTARVVTAKQSLLETLFDPLFAVSRR
ncbi:membrane fusion protein [Sphingomonas sp. UYAg733]